MTGFPVGDLLPVSALPGIGSPLASGRLRRRTCAARGAVALRSAKAEVQFNVDGDDPSDIEGDPDIRSVADAEPQAHQSVAGAVSSLTGPVSVTLATGIRIVLARVVSRPIDLGSSSRSETDGDAETCHGHPFAARTNGYAIKLTNSCRCPFLRADKRRRQSRTVHSRASVVSKLPNQSLHPRLRETGFTEP